MEELQNLIAHLKNQGLTDAKIPVDVWCGIIEYFANKQEAKQCNIADVSQQRELLKTFCEYVDLESHAHPDDIKLDIENHIKGFNCG